MYFFIKTRFVSAFPDRPEYHSTPTCVHLIPSKKPFSYPDFVLLKVSRYVICSKAVPNDPPSKFGHGAQKEQMIYSFIFHAKVTFGIPSPVSADKIVFGENGISLHQPHENLIL